MTFKSQQKLLVHSSPDLWYNLLLGYTSKEIHLEGNKNLALDVPKVG